MTDQPSSTRSPFANDLGQMAHVLREHPALSRALTDPATSQESKTRLIDQAFAPLGEPARQELKEAVAQAWESDKALTSAMMAKAVTTIWRWANDDAQLEETIDQVFEFSRTVLSDHELRAAVTDRKVAVERRQQLVDQLLTPVCTSPAVAIARLALAAGGTIDEALTDFINQGADQAGKKLAVVTVAKSLAPDQKDRLSTALTKRWGHPVIVEEIVDPAVLGSVRVECGAEVIDDTVAARLQIARRDFQ